jgi:hypothetical protein
VDQFGNHIVSFGLKAHFVSGLQRRLVYPTSRFNVCLYVSEWTAGEFTAPTSRFIMKCFLIIFLIKNTSVNTQGKKRNQRSY